jgi:hypothetical protein
MFRLHSMLAARALCFLSVLVLAACGGDKSSEDPGTGGRTSGSGGSGAGGSTATGGSSGAGGLTAHLCDPKAPPGPELTSTIDSMGKWGDAVFGGGAFTYGDGPDADTAADISIDYSAKNLHITGKVAAYTGFGLWFGPVMGQMYPCLDVSGYEGVSFDITDAKGTVDNITFQVQTHATAPVDTVNKRGGCVYQSEATRYSDCLFPGASVTIPAGGGTVETAWADFMGGKPVPTVDPKGIEGLQWQFPWSDGATEYELDVTVSNVKFF